MPSVGCQYSARVNVSSSRYSVSSSDVTDIYLLKKSNEWARSDKDKADIFATYLADVFKAERGHIDDNVADFITAPCQMSLPIRVYTIAEVKTEITRLNTCKAPGYDLITGQILKHLPYKTTALLTLLFNRILTLSYFPVIWKYAEIIMIPKPGKPPHEPTSYRPISLLPITRSCLNGYS